MKRSLYFALGSLTLALLLVPQMPAATTPHSKEKAASTSATAKSTHVTPQVLGPAETIQATLTTVQGNKAILVGKDSSGVPFDFIVTPKTKIVANGERVKLQALTSDVNKRATIDFVPMRKGDVARSIQIIG